MIQTEGKDQLIVPLLFSQDYDITSRTVDWKDKDGNSIPLMNVVFDLR